MMGCAHQLIISYGTSLWKCSQPTPRRSAHFCLYCPFPHSFSHAHSNFHFIRLFHSKVIIRQRMPIKFCIAFSYFIHSFVLFLVYLLESLSCVVYTSDCLPAIQLFGFRGITWTKNSYIFTTWLIKSVVLSTDKHKSPFINRFWVDCSMKSHWKTWHFQSWKHVIFACQWKIKCSNEHSIIFHTNCRTNFT